MVKSFLRGHGVIYIDGQWIYNDTNESINSNRPCIRCNCLPTKEGHDACLGELKDVNHACCGHGVMDPYAIKKT